ncbi:MAG: hypothetical protein WC080_02920 [Patescibacteria group bacterium]|jgi:hypothetical protein
MIQTLNLTGALGLALFGALLALIGFRFGGASVMRWLAAVAIAIAGGWSGYIYAVAIEADWVHGGYMLLKWTGAFELGIACAGVLLFGVGSLFLCGPSFRRKQTASDDT